MTLKEVIKMDKFISIFVFSVWITTAFTLSMCAVGGWAAAVFWLFHTALSGIHPVYGLWATVLLILGIATFNTIWKIVGKEEYERN